MKQAYPVRNFFLFIAAVSLVFHACRKINDYTDIGGGLIPPIDNINTFDTSIRVQAFNDSFRLQTDSLRLTPDDQHFLGLVNNDPIFGKTEAEIYLELKPELSGFFPNGDLPFGRKDSLKVDSIVLVLDYASRYGDTLQPQNIYVNELTQELRDDSSYLVRQRPAAYGSLLNENGIPQQVFPYKLDDSVKVFRDTTAGQMRIRLDTTFARRLMNYDTTNAYRSDSAFTQYLKGFVIRSQGGGNGLMGFTLNGSTNTKLAIYYKKPKKSGTLDSLNVTYFTCYSQCGTANYVRRDYAGTPVHLAAGQVTEAPLVYIQNSPGTFANIRIPDLPAISNRVVHRAELIIEQVYDPSDALFTAPNALFLDAFDPSITTSNKFRTIPYSNDLSSTTGGLDLNTFGVAPRDTVDAFGNKIKIWRFNLSRYVQHVVRGTQTSYDLRLFSPLLYAGKARSAGIDFDISGVYIGTSIANGRVRVGGGNHPNQRMRLRIIYSKL